jgi:hypothetical protein
VVRAFLVLRYPALPDRVNTHYSVGRNTTQRGQILIRAEPTASRWRRYWTCRRVLLATITVVVAAICSFTGVAGAASSLWTIQATQNPPGAQYAQLSAISCNGATNCMAVGTWYQSSYQNSETLAESWNGTSWATLSTPNPTGTSDDELYGISCPTSNICVAVGEARSNSHPIIERWSGGKWSLQNPGYAGTALNGVSCVSSSFCVAVGADAGPALVDRWNGKSWTTATTITPSGYSGAVLNSVSCTSSTACIAVGAASDSSGHQHLLAARWNGASWTTQVLDYPTSANSGGLSSVACPSPTSCMAVGWAGNPSIGSQAAVESWNGSTWTVGSVPSGIGAANTIPESVACTTSKACETVGYTAGTNSTWAANWNGMTWALDQTPNPSGADQSSLNGVSCTKLGGCAAAGFGYSGTATATLAEHT